MIESHNILAAIGNTPLIRLKRITEGLNAEIYVKAEYLNPSGSIKDRIALYMIEDAEKTGNLKPGYTIVEASTGNTAAALAFVASVKGYQLRVFVPDVVANPERMRLIESYGGQVEYVKTWADDVITNDTSAHGADTELTARQKCAEVEQSSHTVWWARQFSNPNNTLAHREGTGKEILEQTNGHISAFIASVGTGGTLLGVAQALHADNPKIEIIGVEPASAGMPYLRLGMENSKFISGITDGIIVDILKSKIVSEVYSVTDKEAIYMAHQLSEKEGLFCGMSSGANVLIALKVAKRLGKGSCVVTVLPDNRDRYLSLEKYTT